MINHEEKYNKFEIIRFFLYFFIVSLVSFAFLYLFGLVPSSLKNVVVNYPQINVEQPAVGFAPTRILIEKIGVDSLVYNPTDSDIKTLNRYLNYGAVRYPGSGLIAKGNMFIFGHSADVYNSINNPAFKTFNGIKKLEGGDQIKVFSNQDVYIYEVHSVNLVSADRALVEFGGNENKLTISTCNTFGAKEERYVVEASYIEKQP